MRQVLPGDPKATVFRCLYSALQGSYAVGVGVTVGF